MRSRSIVALLAAAAILYLARDVLIPLALAILLAFLLAPAVRRLGRWKLGRILSTLIVVVFGFSLIGAIGWVAGVQAVSLAAKLPEYRALAPDMKIEDTTQSLVAIKEQYRQRKRLR